MNTPHILLLTADVGFGHRSACQAIAAALEQIAPGACQITSLNLVEHPLAPALLRLPEQQYDRTVTYGMGLYALTYRASNTRLACSLVSSVMSRGLAPATRQIIDDLQPDAILSTLHMYQAPVLYARLHMQRHIPFFTVVTDLANVHQMWLHSAPDVLFVPNEIVRRQALVHGQPEERVVISGIPINPSFANQQHSPAEIRKQLGWDPLQPVALVVGSRRTPHLAESLAAVNAARHPLQLAIIAGGDNTLYQQLKAINWHIPAYIYNYVQNMAELMHAADVLVTKAGGLITAEALACGLPLIFIDHIPGQETGNLEYVVGQGAGVSLDTAEALAQTLQDWLAENGARLRQFAHRAQQLGHPQAAQTIAARLWQAAVEHHQAGAISPSSTTKQPRQSFYRLFK